jgi:hypothetical protein
MKIDDIDVFDSMRALLDDGVDLDDKTAVESALINPYDHDPETSRRFIAWASRRPRPIRLLAGCSVIASVPPALCPQNADRIHRRRWRTAQRKEAQQ